MTRPAPAAGEPREEFRMRYLPWPEFQRLGYLLEVNRQFLHPLGLALALVVEDDGTARALVQDARDDPAGLRFAVLDTEDRARAQSVVNAMACRVYERHERLGYWVQPLDDPAAVPPEAGA